MESEQVSCVPALARRTTTVVALALFMYAIRTWLINRNEQRQGPPSHG